MPGEDVRIEVNGEVVLQGDFSGGTAGGAVVLHPHPLYGGSMHNNVVDALARGAQEAGFAVLKFNFRGVGRSGGQHDHGEGEQEDVLAAMNWLAGRSQGPQVIMGYSFGSLVGSAAAGRIDNLAAGVWMAPPWVMGPLAPWPDGAGPLLVMAGERDEFGNLEALKEYMAGLGARGRLEVVTGADHFCIGRESALSEQTSAFLQDIA